MSSCHLTHHEHTHDIYNTIKTSFYQSTLASAKVLWVMNESLTLRATVTTFIAKAVCTVCSIQLALDLKLGGVQGVTVELSIETKQRTCTHVHKKNNTEQETTLTLSLRDACRLRHLRWFWRQRTSQFRGLCSNTTTCKWGLSHQVFLPAAHFSLMHSVCEDCSRFALDFGVYKKNMYNKIQIA